jgi:hypothetical protein
MVEKLKPFSGVPFDIAVMPGDETVGLLDQLIPILKNAGWTWRPEVGSRSVFDVPGMPSMSSIVMFGGLFVSITPAKETEWGKAMNALAGALRTSGITTNSWAKDGVNDNAIHISIGTKPHTKLQ